MCRDASSVIIHTSLLCALFDSTIPTYTYAIYIILVCVIFFFLVFRFFSNLLN